MENKTNNENENLVEEKPAEEKPAEEKPVEEKPAEEKPAEEKPAEEKPVEEKPAEEKPAEEKPTDNVGVKILGGFFVFRSNPTESAPISELITQPGSSTGTEFAQKGEIVGIVLLKQYGIRKFYGYSPIDPATFKLDQFITNFSNTNLNNPYDNNKTNVFDMDTLDVFMNKMIVQPMV